MVVVVTEGIHAKRVHIAFWANFHFCRIELIFGRLTCFDMKSIVQLFLLICVCKKNSVFQVASLGANPTKVDFAAMQT